MTTPNDQYPNDGQPYPNGEPGFQAELYRLAPSKVTVLLRGGGAALKRAVAQALHERSPRAAGPFVAIDCCGLDSDRVEQQLFGGPAYTPVRGGAIEQAGAGTLYVATIDELPLLVQPRFLRFLDQERQARVVASAERELGAQVERGHFRLDLAERLTLVELLLPMTLKSV